MRSELNRIEFTIYVLIEFFLDVLCDVLFNGVFGEALLSDAVRLRLHFIGHVGHLEALLGDFIVLSLSHRFIFKIKCIHFFWK
jgi:hypothetical protein